MILISQVLLLLGAVIAASFSYRAAQSMKEGQQIHMMVISLASAFVAMAAVAEMTLTSTDLDAETLKRMLVNLAVFAGLPLISSALVALAKGWEWSRAAWGRWLLVLFAMFELCRRSGVGETYSEWLMVAISVSWLFAAMHLGRGLSRLLAVASALLTGCALVLFSPFALAGASNDVLYALTLAAALALLGNQSGRLVSPS